jgi:hypothetical protein
VLLLLLFLLPWVLIPCLLFAARPVVTGTSAGEDVPSPPVKWTPHPVEHVPFRFQWLTGIVPALGLLLLLGAGWMGHNPAAWTVLIGMLPLPLLHRTAQSACRNLAAEEARASQEMAWIVWRRGSIQDGIMRAREHEAMDRRMRRCRSTLLLSQDDGEDVDHLFRTLESRLATPHVDRHASAALVGGMASHLRHVFIERDRDDVSFGETAGHIARWARWLEDMGTGPVDIVGAPEPGSSLYARKVPSTLFLGMAERMGIAFLECTETPGIQWIWSLEEDRVRLSTSGGPMTPWSEHTCKDWDAAFMLRHGGISHAGGAWHFELPLIPE